jgi:hypothetical protein
MTTARRKARQSLTAAARRHLVTDSFCGPHGSTDTVQRVANPLAQLRNRRQIDPVQYAAGERYRTAAEHIRGKLACPLAAEAAGRLPPASRAPPEAALDAAATLREARELLGVVDTAVVHSVCGEGFSVIETARRLFRANGSVTYRQSEATGHRLKIALSLLAEAWFPSRRRSIARASFRLPDAVPSGELTRAGLSIAHIRIGSLHVSSYRVSGPGI